MIDAWVPDACTLPAAEQPLRLAEFGALLRTALREQQRSSPTVLRWRLDPAALPAARDLTDRESVCCSFFTFRYEGPWLAIEVPESRVAVLDALAARA